MSNAIGYTLNALTFDGTSVQRDDLSVHLEVTLGLDEVSDYRGVDTTIPATPGRTSRTWKADTRDIELSGMVQGNVGMDEAARLGSFRDIVEELKTLFQPGGAPSVLTGTGKDGATYSINAKPIQQGALKWGPQNIPGYRELTVVLVSLDPEWEVSGGS